MKKIVFMLFLVICLCFGLASCEGGTTTTDDQDPSLKDIDITKYEQPQTEFLNDGHTLSDFEQLAKYIIENGTFVYDNKLDGIGYRIYLKEEINSDSTGNTKDDAYYVAFYCVDSIKIAKEYYQKVQRVSGSGQLKTSYYNAVTYTKLTNNDDLSTFAICHKLSNTMGTAYYSIYDCARKDYTKDTAGSYSLYRCDLNNIDQDTMTTTSKEEMETILQLFDEVIGSKTSYNLSNLGF